MNKTILTVVLLFFFLFIRIERRWIDIQGGVNVRSDIRTDIDLCKEYFYYESY